METTFLRIDVTEMANTFHDWHDWCGVSNPYEVFILKGNSLLQSMTSAGWYDRCLNAIFGVEVDVQSGYEYEYDPQYGGIDYEQWKKICQLVKANLVDTKLERIKLIAEILYPDWKFDFGTIRGYTQSDWQDVLYRSDKGNLEMLEAAYFAKMYMVTRDDTGELVAIPHSEFWRGEMQKGGVVEFLRQRLKIGNDVEIEVFKEGDGINIGEFTQIG